VGRDEQVDFDQPEKMTEQMRLSKGLINSKVNLDQQMQLTEEEDQNDILMTGGIEIFLPSSQEEAESCIAGAATAKEQSSGTVKEELEQTLEASQAEAEAKEDVALKLAAKEAKE
jgi:hypothetical protein